MSPKTSILILAAILAGCRSTERAALSDDPAAPEFPDIKYMVNPLTIFHEVRLYYEMDRAPKELEGGAFEQPAFNRFPQEVETYTFGYRENPWLHKLSYQGGKFIVGDFSYPAEENSVLYIMKERPGPFSFRFHDRRITIDRSTAWKPAVLYRQIEEVKDVGGAAPTGSSRRGSSRTGSKIRRVQTRVVGEELQVGPHRITVVPGKPVWQVNGFRVQPQPGDTIVIDREGNVRTS